MANKNFKPRASTNLVEEGIVEESVGISEKVDKANKTEKVEEEAIVEEVIDTLEEEEEITFNPVTKSKPITQMVKIHLARPFNGCIGGTWYHLDRDQVVNVPENVKRILNSMEGMLKPL